MKLFLLLTFLMSIISTSIFGQAQDEKEENTKAHEHYKNEIAAAISPAYFVKEKVLTYAIHVHYTRNIPNTQFGIGVSFERVVLAPKHSTYGLVLTYRPIEALSFTLSPGVTFEDDDPSSLFAMHIETAYEFELGRFHLGPAFEFAYDPNDYHVSLGIHIGFGF